MIYATIPLPKDVAGSQQMKRNRNSIGGKVNVHLIYACGSSEHVNFLDYSISNDDYLPGYGLTIHRISLTCNKYTHKSSFRDSILHPGADEMRNVSTNHSPRSSCVCSPRVFRLSIHAFHQYNTKVQLPKNIKYMSSLDFREQNLLFDGTELP